MSDVEAAEAVLREALEAGAAALGGEPGAFDRPARDPVPERAGAVTSGLAARIAIARPDEALEAVARRWRTAGWQVTSTPVAVLAQRHGLTVSLVLDAGGSSARLSGGTPPLPAH